jgi:N-sulfoglucosamine sulfohydrolase
MRSFVPLPPGAVTYPELMRQAGYYCTNNSKTDYNLSPYQQNAWNQMTQGDYKNRKPGQPFFAQLLEHPKDGSDIRSGEG